MLRIRRAATLGEWLRVLGLGLALGHGTARGLVGAGVDPTKPDPVTVGYEIFNREWIPNDPRAHGGDGLGPVYNDTSCVACHNLGGSGGAGPAGKNIELLNAAGIRTRSVDPDGSRSRASADDALIDFHAGFRLSRTVVLHKFSVDPNYATWRGKVRFPATTAVDKEADTFAALEAIGNEVLSQPAGGRDGQVFDKPARTPRLAGARAVINSTISIGPSIVSRSQRSPTSLYGLGLIDAIPDAAIEEMAHREAMESRATAGTLSVLKGGRIGRLGWKGQVASAEEFVLSACAGELGLEVPGHHQSLPPQAPKHQGPGLDLTAEECAALTAYVCSLRRPIERPVSSTEEAKFRAAGKATFAAIGCASCHVPKLGDVEGIYSDLLLHDLGPQLADAGTYYGTTLDEGSDDPLVSAPANSNGGDRRPAPGPPALPARPARPGEWRTPPLWGFRDSGPYLHDGRAETLEQAVALHDGQGKDSALAFFKLSPRERFQVESFLKSLIAPPSTELAPGAQ